MAQPDTIFLTGGTGFLGKALVPLLTSEGYALRVLTRHPQQNTWLNSFPHVQVIYGDLTDAAHVQSAMSGCRYVIHAAGLFSMWDQAGNFDANNVLATQNVVSAAQANNIERLAYVSTVAVMGNPPSGTIITEQTTPAPADAYQRSKLTAEQVIQSAVAAGLGASIARAGAYYGPYGDYAFNRLFFRDPMRGIIMQMDGGHYVIFPAYIGDVARGILATLLHGGPGEVYNICGDPISHRDAFDIICRQANIHWPRMNVPNWLGITMSRLLTGMAYITRREPFWPLNLRSYVFNDWPVSSEKARRELGFTSLPFEQGAHKTLAWYRAGCPPHPTPPPSDA
ncbi:MAG: NAD-dependent epimerase/dehydratase family protein [Anaerolineae bacterium]|nr:NAD-dependent epimerase/dehydratase family protein [Anaerolineae bacterium]